MSDEERWKIIGKTISDLDEAKKRLAALRIKAKSLGDFVHLVANVLTGTARHCRIAGDEISVGTFNMSPGGTGTWPTIDEVRDLLLQIDTTTADIEELERRRKDLGV